MKAATRTLIPLFVAFLCLLGSGTTPLPAAAAPPPAQQQATYRTQIAELLDLHNTIRAEHGLGPLRYSPTLAVEFSQPYNDQLADADAPLEHQDLRPLVAWPGATSAGENLYWGGGSLGTPSAAMEGWMKSEGHRDNILTPEFNHIAIGWSRSPGGRMYSTVNFWGGNLTGLGTTYANGAQLLAGSSGGSDVDVYTTPGHHHVNGREWNTACEPYSQTSRCRTEIVATQVRYANGSYSRVTGWAFNNLTYLPSERSLWRQNPLGHDGSWTADDGRRWRTECDTAATGRNGCRSYTWATVLGAVARSGGGYTYTRENKWVFNNIVRFK